MYIHVHFTYSTIYALTAHVSSAPNLQISLLPLFSNIASYQVWQSREKYIQSGIRSNA